MNLNPRYLFGQALFGGIRSVLASSHLPLFRTLFSGVEWAYDASRYAGTRDFRLLLDVGANVGQTALYMHQFFPDSEIHAFELSTATTAQLRANTRRHPGIHVHNLAAGRAPARLRVSIQDCSLVNSLRFATAADTGRTEEIEVVTLDDFCRARNISFIDVLKTDAQGFDLDVMHGAAGLLASQRIRFILTEVTFVPGHTDAQAFVPMDEYLRTQGFQLCGFYDQWFTGSVMDCCNALYINPNAVQNLP